MNTLPLHPAIVHLPLGLAMILPFIAAGFAWALWSGRVRTRAWVAVVALQAVLLGSALVAINTGGAEEERVEAVVPEAPLHAHEEMAEQFAWAAGLTLVLSLGVLVFTRHATAGLLSAAVVVATVIVAGLGLRVGHAGGQLVYVHGAASAYTSSSSNAPARTPTAPDFGRDEDNRDAGKGVE